MQNLSSYDAMLKLDYGPRVVSMLNKKTKLEGKFTKNTDIQAEGRNFVFPIHIGRNQGVGSVGESKNLPSAGYQDTTDVTVAYKYTYGRIQLSQQTIKASKTSKGAFKQSMRFEMDNLVTDLARLRNRQLWGFGVGILARVNGQQLTNTVINVKDRHGVAGATGGATLILKNSYVAFVRNATPTSATDADIQAVKLVSALASDYSSITLSAASGVTLNDNDMIILAPAGADTTTQSSVNREPEGLLGIVDDGTYKGTLHGIVRSTYDQYKSTVLSLNGSISLDVLQRAFDLADEKAGGQITDMMAHHSVRREYLKLLQTQKRFVNEGTKAPDGGWKGGAIDSNIDFNEKPLIPERMAPYGMIFGLDFSTAERYVNCDGEWADDDGSVLMRVLNQDDYEGRYRIFDNFHINRPDKCFRIDGVTATVDVTSAE